MYALALSLVISAHVDWPLKRMTNDVKLILGQWQREKRLCNDILPDGETLDRVYDSSAQTLVDLLANTGDGVIKEATKGLYVPGLAHIMAPPAF